jgi:2-phosphosulfolactate phosphatase
MRIEVIEHVDAIHTKSLQGKTVIVIDVFRATSTIITALAYGCSSIIIADSVEHAISMKLDDVWLGGERNGIKIRGFDLGNSPLDYQNSKIREKHLVFTTTNGTKALQTAKHAAYTIAGAFLNSLACAKRVLALTQDVVILCAGTESKFALEDGLCAGCMISDLHRISANTVFDINDLGRAMLACFEQCHPQLEYRLRNSQNGQKLIALREESDISYCTKMNQIDLVPRYQAGIIKPWDKVLKKETAHIFT